MHKRLTARSKRTVMMAADVALMTFALWVSVVLRYGEIWKDVTPFWWLFPAASLSGVIALQRFSFYRAVVRYIGPSSMVPVVQGVTVATLVVSLVAYLTQAVAFPRASPIIFWFISILLIGGSRIVIRAYFYGLQNNFLTREPVAIYGAGDSGAQLAISLLNGMSCIPVAFIDDNRALRKNTIHGIRVHGSNHIDRVVDDYGIKQIFLAVPSATTEQRGVILNKLASLPILVKTIPTFEDLITGAAAVSEVREVELADLLGRETVPPDQALIESSVKDKAVLVTGAGGTIGSEICRKILTLEPARLVVYDNSEIALYEMKKELEGLCSEDTELVILLGTIMNAKHLSKVMHSFGIQTVYHAAAFKHVAIVEGNVLEGVRNNVVGTWNVAKVADACGVEEFVLISSDKAVRPTNVMGATKRLAELIVQAFANQSTTTRFCMVRFGNVLRSSGSVVPLFEKQILAGGPVTVTHKDATRYFMTASEAAELVIQAGAMADGGELFVLDMGEPVKINDLAIKMIHLHGRHVKYASEADTPSQAAAIEIKYIGLLPGEKLYEELIIGQAVSGTTHPKIMMAEEDALSLEDITGICEILRNACDSANYAVVKDMLETHVSGYYMHQSSADPVLTLEKKRLQSGNNVTPLIKKEE